MSSSGDSDAAAMYDDIAAISNAKRCFDDIVDDDYNGRIDDEDDDSIHSVSTEEMENLVNNNVVVKDTPQQSAVGRRGGLRSIRERIATPFTTIPSSLLGLRNMGSTIRSIDKKMSQTTILPRHQQQHPSSETHDRVGGVSSSSSLFFPSPMFGSHCVKHEQISEEDHIAADVKPSQSSYSMSPRSSYMSRPSPSLALSSPSMKNKRLIMIRVIRDRMSQISAVLEKLERLEKMEKMEQ